MGLRPKIKLKLSTSDKVIEFVGWLLICAVWVLAISNYKQLPDIIPTHYNGAGVADGYGKKWLILTLPFVATVLFVGITILNKFPHIFNYPFEITENNALKQYTNVTRMTRYLKLVVVIVFGLITYQTIRHANEQAEGLGAWFLPLTIVLIFTPMVYFFIKSFKEK